MARDRDGKGQVTSRNAAPSEYLLSLPGTRPLYARYLSATCSVLNRTNTEQVMHMCRTKASLMAFAYRHALRSLS